MKLEEKYPNYLVSMSIFHIDRSLTFQCSDSKLISHSIPLASVKNGFDFYELEKSELGLIHFKIVTMSGLRTILATYSDTVNNDLSVEEWEQILMDTSIKHFMKEEYIALKNGYVKQSESGCLGMLLAIVLIISMGFCLV